MKRLPLAIAFALSLIFLPSCSKEDDSYTMEDLKEDVDDYSDKAKDKADDLGDATEESYDAYKEAIEN
ncbi:MAG TPA: hypothetical protein DIU37_00770 [Opitutae bacterium]|nr:hypothetical protein [Opitutae bacterium]